MAYNEELWQPATIPDNLDSIAGVLMQDPIAGKSLAIAWEMLGRTNARISRALKALDRGRIIVDEDSPDPSNSGVLWLDPSGPTLYWDDIDASPAEWTVLMDFSPKEDDLRMPATASKLGGLKDPNWVQLRDDGAGSTGVYSYAFDKNTEEELFFACQLPHNWVGTDLAPHVHWAPASSGIASSTVRWGLEYSWADIDAVFPTTSTIYGEATQTVANRRHYMTFFTGGISATGKSYSSMLMCRLFRDASHANDTYASDAFLLEFDIHYEKSGFGTTP